MDSNIDTQANSLAERKIYHTLNAKLKLAHNGLQLDDDQAAITSYLTDFVIPNTKNFDSINNKINWLIENEYYDQELINKYNLDDVIDLFDYANNFGFKFQSFVGAFKYYSAYALKTFDGKNILENFAERSVMVSLLLAEGNIETAKNILQEILSQRFQPATPTFLNAGKKQRGEYVSCFLLRIEDNLESIGRAINSSLQLSKRGGGVALLLTNLREAGAPIKKIKNQSSGVVPVMKILEDSFSYANQLGARQGAGCVYLHAHHPDIMAYLDTKRENADEKIRIKTLSLGIVIPDITFELAKNNQDMYLFSPYDIYNEYGVAMSDISISEKYQELIDNPKITKTKINARAFFQTIAEIQFESGYPYLMFEDTVNKAHVNKGWINMSNLCSEILQVNTPSIYNTDLGYKQLGEDISCNLGSLNIAKTMQSPNFAKTVELAVRSLTSVSTQTNIDSVPSIKYGNELSHAIGLGQMNLHGFLGSNYIEYGSEDALDFVNVYFYCITYYSLLASNKLAQEKQKTYHGFNESKYATGEYFDQFIESPVTAKSELINNLFKNINIPNADDWQALKLSVMRDGLYNKYLQAVPPTGSISYINNSTPSIHPITAKIEVRKEGKLGRVYFPAPHMNNENISYFKDAYEIGYEKIIDTYAVASKYVDQGISATLFFKDTATTRDLNKAYIHAWKKGLKALYYVRIKQKGLSGTEVEELLTDFECESCVL